MSGDEDAKEDGKPHPPRPRISLRFKPKEFGGGYTALIESGGERGTTQISHGVGADAKTAAKWALHHAYKLVDECAKTLIDMGMLSEEDVDWISEGGMVPRTDEDDERDAS